MTNLPADLPENWTRGQLVSPNGTEVGLTTQHGYNYLMAQVNAAQTAINNIVESLGEVAQETSVQDILSLIGATADTGATDTTGSLMGKANALIGAVYNLDVPTIKYNQQFISNIFTVPADTTTKLTSEFVFNGKKNIKRIYWSSNMSGSHYYCDLQTVDIDVDGTVYNFFINKKLMSRSVGLFVLDLSSPMTFGRLDFYSMSNIDNSIETSAYIPLTLSVQNNLKITITYTGVNNQTYSFTGNIIVIYTDE